MRQIVKQGLAKLSADEPGSGLTALIYHRVGGGSADERDVLSARFREQVSSLADSPVTSMDAAVRKLQGGDVSPSVVLTFDDGFADVYDNAWPVLRDAGLPFTIYVATSFLGRTMHWDGSTAKDVGAPALTWDQLGEMVASGLCTVGNHTHDHVRPQVLVAEQLDRCSSLLEQRIGVRPRHFAYPWGVPVPRMDSALRSRFMTAATGHLGRARPGDDLMRIPRIPVRGSDPLSFFEAKLRGSLVPERVYGALVAAAKRVGARA